jgi:exopolyphosphatase/guanosine-5'-triphosphate,3'-diphosphate pyrophosphatase
VNSETFRLAALDYGTITSRLLIADLDADSINTCLRLSTITHLGEGLASTGMISAASIERLVSASNDFMAAINSFAIASESGDGVPVRLVKAIATSAMRDASNSQQVVAALAEVGIELEVVSGEHEARLSFTGTLSGFEASLVASKTILVIDIGGGSTELVYGTMLESGTAEILKSVSIDIGGRRITDQCFLSDPPTDNELAEARRLVNLELAAWLNEARESELHADMVIAVAGTATSLVAIRDRLEVYDSDHVHGQVITRSQLETVLGKLAAMPLAERQSVVGLQPARAEVIVGGLVILCELYEQLQIDKLVVGETDILQGVLLETYHRLTHTD